jgi:hypothetical protein
VAASGCAGWHADISMMSPGGVGVLKSVVGPADVSIDWSTFNGSVGSTGQAGPTGQLHKRG